MLGGIGRVSESSTFCTFADETDTGNSGNVAPVLDGGRGRDRGLEDSGGWSPGTSAAVEKTALRKDLLLRTTDERRWRGDDGKIPMI